MPVYCEVALPVPLDRTFTYAIGADQRPTRGGRVIAPFRNEKLIGIVTVSDAVAPTDFDARELEAVLDNEPILSEHLLKLAEWIAQYYLAPLGEVLRGMLPLMAEVRRTVYYHITDLGRDVFAGSIDGEIKSRNSRKSSSKRHDSVSGAEQDIEHRVLARLISGDRVSVSTLRTATAASLHVLAALVRRKWIGRENVATERDARRTERFAVVIPDTRLPRLSEKQQAVLARHSRRAAVKCRWQSCAPATFHHQRCRRWCVAAW